MSKFSKFMERLLGNVAAMYRRIYLPKVLIINALRVIWRLKQQFSIWVLQSVVAADSSAECHASNTKLRIRRMNPPLQKLKSEQLFFPIRCIFF
jgi:hypothetical protein